MTIFEADEIVNEKNILVKVDQPSVLRVSCREAQQELREKNYTLKLTKSFLTIAAGNNTLYAQLSSNENYTLSLRRPLDAVPNSNLVQSFELAVEPITAMDNYVTNKAMDLSKCDPLSEHGTASPSFLRSNTC